MEILKRDAICAAHPNCDGCPYNEENCVDAMPTDDVYGIVYTRAIKAMETVQRIDDVLNAEGMTADDAIHEIIVAIDEFKYDCGGE